MITRFEKGKIDEGNRALSARRDESSKAFFQFANPGRQFQGSWRAEKAVGVADFVLIPRIPHCGCVWK